MTGQAGETVIPKINSGLKPPWNFYGKVQGQLLKVHASFSPSLGAVTGRIVTTGNISAEEGGSVTLQCHLSSTTAKVTQVNWKQQDQVLAIHHASLGWHIDPAFTERTVPGPNLGLTLQSLTRNDTGEYICIYHTYPDGIYKGTFFLEVLQSPVAEHSAGFQIPLLGAMATVLAVIGTAVIVVVTLARKVMTLAAYLSPGHPISATLVLSCPLCV
ncbi:hypothetical protein E2I00_007029 [Balaenoptera physalus]|uniref:T-cell immunoreceptor with Ig and ITIM domains n=1 Tax=Balaenoptera physalus TaxID=9770 RepID=A0A643C7M0_BALPH|nr:hypothetical protein E2I00_007029 [Balaenoptera physalus]